MTDTSPGPSRVLELSDVAKRFGGVQALRGIDFDVRRGEVHALVGENGSGKSTLVKILAGYHTPEPGATARVDGQDFELGSAHAAHAAGIRFVHQELALVEGLDAVENIALARGYEVRGGIIRWRAERRRAVAALARLGYTLPVTRPIGQLPIAERTVVAIARAIDEPEGDIHLLVLDEPTASLSAGEASRLFEVVRAVREHGISVIFVSHHLDEVLNLADRITVLRDGNRIGTFEASTLDHGRLIELITGRELAEHLNVTGDTEGTREIVRVCGLTSDTLNGLDFVLKEGEILGVAGLTGSGRDELPLLLAGLGTRRAGTIEIGGRDVGQLTPEKATSLGAALVSGDRLRYGLISSFSVRENLTLSRLKSAVVAGVLRVSRERVEARRLIELFGIKVEGPETNIMALSGGNQQKVLFARVMRTKPKLLLLDDPTRGVDVGSKAEIHRHIDQAAADGAAVMFTSSDDEELARVCRRVIVLKRGNVVRELHGDEIDANRLTQLAL
jgi:ribose transport system ATP-binding protein